MKNRVFFLILSCLFILQGSALFAANIGLLIVATGKYDRFVDPLIASARKYFCPEDNITYYVFLDGHISEAEDVVPIYQKRLGWPYDTLMRNSIYYEHKDLLEEQDYLFALDADMLFVDTVGREILGDLVATRHPGFFNKRGSYETRPESTAYVGPREGSFYYAGGFFGGKKNRFFHILSKTTHKIKQDLERNIIAIWHDESHWNRYCIDHKPTVVLNPSYCYPENEKLPFPKKLLALDKNHAEIRK